MTKRKKTRNKLPQQIVPQGWLTSDADEIERRRVRGVNDFTRRKTTRLDSGFFGTYPVSSDSGQIYRVEIRSLGKRLNTCNCPDHLINRLGTCKHIEATLLRLEYRRKRAFRKAASEGSPYIEIFLNRAQQKVQILWPETSRRDSKAKSLIAAFFSDEHILAGNPLDTIPAMRRAISASHASSRRAIRVSEELTPWLESLNRRQQQIRDRQHFETEVAAGNASLDFLKHPLYTYQQEGMLHLAFKGRALLADEMGLGKTVQAIAACELLRRTANIQKVLVISPASLKGEWQEQIAKFTNLPSLIVEGSRAKRCLQYESQSFFYLANYEQIRRDIDEINDVLKPDVIILDEAQRIKNWQTQTATSLKRLRSPYAFVLTGTPVENRIDEIYSIIQFLDPQVFGPLFRFNRVFYQLDEKGHAIGYQNLHQLHELLQPIMLRRLKEEVEGQLPGRTINTYFLPMHKEQRLRYDEYETKVARIAAIAKTRPLKKEEQERLQQFLACMRMLCDSPYILDQTCRISPKIKELEKILQEIMAEGEHKIIIFSEWQRMLNLVRDLAKQKGLGYAWHTGEVKLPQRRAEIHRFKTDPDCRLFLSTDSGSVGLNLQVADIVINLDLPWNPAKLEQRIARAWRKHQKRSVQVINLVTENSIEHRMLTLLDQKRSLIKGVIDGKGRNEMSLPSGRAALLERLDTLVENKADEQQRSADPIECLRDSIVTRWISHMHLMELHGDGDEQTLLVVVDKLNDSVQQDLTNRLQDQFPHQTPNLKLLDRTTYDTIQELIDTGLLQNKNGSIKILYDARVVDEAEDTQQIKWINEARTRLADSEHNRQMAQVLNAGGFTVEALVPVRDAMEVALQALFIKQGLSSEIPLDLDLVDSTLIQTCLLPADSLSLISQLREDQPAADNTQAQELFARCQQLFGKAVAYIEPG